jgi:very-short-patch-repair endonuclease
MNKFYNYNKNLIQYSRQLRTNSTLAEIILWNEVLKNRKLGYQFHRQRPILNYIADFFCKEIMLIIETDGATHLYEDSERKDKDREKNLISNGYSILRFKDVEVAGEIEMVRNRIKSWIEEYEKKHPEVKLKKSRNRRS